MSAPPCICLPRLRCGEWEFPIHHVRGGTSTGLIIAAQAAPRDTTLREELLRHLMGVPQTGELSGNRQINGLGRGPATSNKVFFAETETTPEGAVRLVSTLAQLAADHGRIDWSVNCGNMSSALQLWAIDTGLLRCAPGEPVRVDIRNTNTGVITTSRMTIRQDDGFETAAIPGVDGMFPAVDLFLHDPVGAKTGVLLPTGLPVDVIDGYHASCVDVAVPMVILAAAEFGKTAHETAEELNADADFLNRLRKVWLEAGLRMQLRRPDGQHMTRDEIERSETVPKVCIVGAPRHGGDLAVRYFTPQTLHGSMAVSGGCCLAAAALIPDSVAHAIAHKSVDREEREINVAIEHPAGTLDTTIMARQTDGMPDIISAAYRRSAQILLSGFAPLYQASAALRRALADIAGQTG